MASLTFTRGLSDRKNRFVSLGAGFLIAGACFTLLLVVMRYFIPAVLRWGPPFWPRLLAPLVILIISLFGLRRNLRARAKSARSEALAVISGYPAK